MPNIYKVTSLVDLVIGYALFLCGLAIGFSNSNNYVLCVIAAFIFFEGVLRYLVARSEDFDPKSKKAFLTSLIISGLDVAGFVVTIILCLVFQKTSFPVSFGIVGLLISVLLIVFLFVSRNEGEPNSDPIELKELGAALGISEMIAILLSSLSLIKPNNLPLIEWVFGFAIIVFGFFILGWIDYFFDDYFLQHRAIGLVVDIVCRVVLSVWAIVALFLYNQAVLSYIQANVDNTVKEYSDGFISFFIGIIISEILMLLIRIADTKQRED